MSKVFIAATVLLLVMHTAYRPAQMARSRRAAEKQVPIDRFRNILEAAFFTKETRCYITEGEMAAFLKGKGVFSYKHLHSPSKNSVDRVRQKIHIDDFDGAVTMRLTGVDREPDYSPGILTTYPVYYQSFTSYCFRAQMAFLTIGHFTPAATYCDETNTYSLKEKLACTALSYQNHQSGRGAAIKCRNSPGPV